MAFAPDGLTSVGGYPGDDEKGGGAVRQGRQAQDDRGFHCRGALAEGARRTAPARSASSASASAAASPTRWPCAWAPTWPRRSRSTARSLRPPTSPRSRRRCCCTTRRSTRASPADWPAYEDSAEGQPRDLHRLTCTRAPITASTTTPRRATTKPPPSWPGSARSTSSTNICAGEVQLIPSRHRVRQNAVKACAPAKPRHRNSSKNFALCARNSWNNVRNSALWIWRGSVHNGESRAHRCRGFMLKWVALLVCGFPSWLGAAGLPVVIAKRGPVQTETILFEA